MLRARIACVGFLFLAALVSAQSNSGQTPTPASSPNATTVSTPPPPPKPSAEPIPRNAPRITEPTRLAIIHDFQTQIVYSRTTFPMGVKGLSLKNGKIAPSGTDLQQLLVVWGPALKPGDPAHLSYISIEKDHIHFELNGGAVHRKKWYQRIQVSGNGGQVPLSPNDQTVENPHGSYLDVYFDKYVPEMTAAQLRDLLLPVFDFNAKSKTEAYLASVPPIVKKAIEEHRVLVGMNTEMVVYAKGRAPKKVREKDGDTEYEEWIYGEPPQDVDFVRIVADEVIRVETMKVGGEKIVRTAKEVFLEKPEKEAEAKKEEETERPAKPPTLHRPGEEPEEAPPPAPGASPIPPAPPNTPPPSGGPGEIVAGSR
jgi:hypothetical protein